MRWITFLILLFLAAAAQDAPLGAFPRHGELWPKIEFLPLLAIFYALYAAEAAAPLAALACGAAYDLLNANQFLGTDLVPLALVAWMIVRIRLSIFREHIVSQIVMTLLGVLGFAALGIVFRKIIGAPLLYQSVWSQFGHLAGNAVYTAAVAPVVYAILFRFRNALGFTSHGTRARRG